MPSATLKTVAFAVAATTAFLAAAPAIASDREIVINFGRDGDLLEQLIELDSEGIEDMRAEIAEARAEIADAIADIEEAREDVKAVPGGGVILRIAFATARAGASAAVDEALSDARREIDRAEDELKSAAVSAEERSETQGAIEILRTELDALEASLNELFAALRA